MKIVRFTFLLFILIPFLGCATASKKDKISGEAEESLRSIAGGIMGKPLTDQEVKDLSRQLQKDPQARSAVESLTSSISGTPGSVKYCPLDGKRFASRIKECPEHHVPLKEVDD